MVRLPSGLTGKRQHERALEALARRGRLRRLVPAAGIDFTSNDYLGLANSAELRDAAAGALARGVPLGAGGSRLLRGNHPEHEALEAEAAALFGAEAALYFGSGFAANAALIATLPGHGDLIVHDALIHASAWEGMGQTKASCVAARHNDVQSFA
ncbi:MAG: aminotransferase class I/II-fold pyridoxal phosphate-dependent enzyme, partial [Hyphomicrobiaceae bacterium]